MLTIDQIELTRNVVRPPVLVVLEALYLGLPVKLGEHEYIMGERKDNSQQLILKMADGRNFLGHDPELSWLTGESNRLTKEYVDTLINHIAFNRMKRDHAKLRERRPRDEKTETA